MTGSLCALLRNLEHVFVLVCSGRMWRIETEPAPARTGKGWRRWISLSLLVLVSVVGVLYALVFVRIVPPRSVRVVDAITGKPVAGMDVCLQVFSNGWTKQALKSDWETTNSNGRALFLPSVLNLRLLQSFDGYSMQVTDPTSHFAQTCGPEVGFKLGPQVTEGAENFADARTDGSEHFPVELVKQEELPKNIGRYPFMRGTDFRVFMSVKVVPVLPDADRCQPLSDPQLLQECTRLYAMARNYLLQELVPMYFGGMQRAAVQTLDHGWSPGTHVYNAVYETRSDPPRFLTVTIEQFPKGQDSTGHMNDVTFGIPDYDAASVTEDEVVPGQKVKRIVSAQTPRAFWASQNLVVLLSFPTPSRFDRMVIGQWLIKHPSNPR